MNLYEKVYIDKLNTYRKAYRILMDYWDCLPDEDKPKIDRALKSVGL